MATAVHWSSRTDDWSTPDWVVEPLRREFRFTLDVAASADNAKCARFFTVEDDGLAQPWQGSVWMNPPYGRAIGQWVKKAAASAAAGATVVSLLPARTDTRWWHAHVWDGASHRPRAGVEVRFLAGRLRFQGHKKDAPFPSAVVVFRPPPA